MSLALTQIQSILNTYHRQQVQSRLTGARTGQYKSGRKGAKGGEDKVNISAEAKRIQVYQKMAEDVLTRFMTEVDREPSPSE